MSAPPTSNARLDWLDWAKAVGMFLVVYGHSLAVPGWAYAWIYSFHMPLFFLISGFLLKPESLRARFSSFAADSARALLPAYFTFAAVGYVSWLFVLRRFGEPDDTPIAYPLLATLYGTGTHESFTVQPMVLWFLPCLFTARLLIHAISQLTPVARAVSSLALLTLGVSWPASVALPWELESALVAQSFMLLGVLARDRGVIDSLRRPYAWSGVLLLVGLACVSLNTSVDLRESRYGNPLLFVLGAVTTSSALVLALRSQRANRSVSAIARNTLLIFPLHPLLFSFFAAFYVFGLGLPLAIRTHPAVGLLASAANVAILVAGSTLVRRYLPWIYGLRRSAPATRAGAPNTP